MATYTDRVMVVSPSGVPTRVGAEDTIELSSGNLKVGGDLTANGEVTVQSEDAVTIDANIINISGDTPSEDGYSVMIEAQSGDMNLGAQDGYLRLEASDGVSIASGDNSIGLDSFSDTIDVDTTGNFGVVAGSSNFMFNDNNSSAFLVEDVAGVDYLKIVSTDSSEEVVFGNTNTSPDFNFVGGGKIIFSTFLASEELLAGQALCLISDVAVGIASANNSSKAHIVGVAVENCSVGNLVKMSCVPGVKLNIINNLGNNIAVGSEVYLSGNSGQFTVTAPVSSGSVVFKAGYALSANQILFQPQFIKANV